MSYANGTTHYNFPQIIGSDRPTFVDFNEAFRTLDQNLFELTGDAESIDTRLSTVETTVASQGTKLVSVEAKANEADAKADTNASAIINLDSEKQNKADNTLTTTNKTVVGAINEIDSDLAAMSNVRNVTFLGSINITPNSDGTFQITAPQLVGNMPAGTAIIFSGSHTGTSPVSVQVTSFDNVTGAVMGTTYPNTSATFNTALIALAPIS